MKSSSPNNGTLTREQFLFYKMCAAAKLLARGFTDAEAAEAVLKANLFQYPAEKSIKKVCAACLKRLHAMNDGCFVEGVATLPADAAKQICLYAMMKQNRLARDLMITVAGEKYRSSDTSFGRADVNAFFMRLAEQYGNAASWSDSTVQKIKQIFVRALAENAYLDNICADRLNPVLIGSLLEERIRAKGGNAALIAFNCMSRE